MGQYFLAMNVSKREYVDSDGIGCLPKLRAWCASRSAGVFPYLLRKSSALGGGDVDRNDMPFAGRWAGDKIYLVGHYDESELYQKALKRFHNISKELVEEYNEFIENEEWQLRP